MQWLKSGSAGNEMEQDVMQAHAQYIYFLACEATSQLDRCKLAQI